MARVSSRVRNVNTCGASQPGIGGIKGVDPVANTSASQPSVRAVVCTSRASTFTAIAFSPRSTVDAARLVPVVILQTDVCSLLFTAQDRRKLEQVSEYAYKHAQERNDFIAGRNKNMPDGGPGMTNQEAQDILDKAKQDGTQAALEKHAQTLNDWTEGTRRVLLDNGLISQNEYDAWGQMFSNYSALRGKVGESAKKGNGTGKGFDAWR